MLVPFKPALVNYIANMFANCFVDGLYPQVVDCNRPNIFLEGLRRTLLLIRESFVLVASDNDLGLISPCHDATGH